MFVIIFITSISGGVVPKSIDKVFNFEASLKALNEDVERMEKGDLSLEESLKTFEHGIQLTRDCQKILSEAEQKVQILIEKNGSIDFSPYQSNHTNDDVE